MSQPAASDAANNSTVRLTDKKVPERHERALVRKATKALVELGMQNKRARRMAIAYASDAPKSNDGWEHWLRNSLRDLDPTGEAAARNANRADPRGRNARRRHDIREHRDGNGGDDR